MKNAQLNRVMFLKLDLLMRGGFCKETEFTLLGNMNCG
jgi:hypothetical protein